MYAVYGQFRMTNVFVLPNFTLSFLPTLEGTFKPHHNLFEFQESTTLKKCVLKRLGENPMKDNSKEDISRVQPQSLNWKMCI